jgi:hypothetical protein
VIAGKYKFVYCGANDVGMGLFTIGQDGSFWGQDIGGVQYKGTAREDANGWITLDLELTIPSGTQLVQGTAVQDVPHGRSVHAFLPPGFGDGHPQQIQAAPGIVTVMVKRVPDETASPSAGTTMHWVGEL